MQLKDKRNLIHVYIMNSCGSMYGIHFLNEYIILSVYIHIRVAGTVGDAVQCIASSPGSPSRAHVII